MIKKFILTLKNKKLLKELESIHIRNSALQDYKRYVWNNRYEEDEKLIKKLKRNFILAEKVNSYTKKYGNLYIYHNDNTITKIFNQKGTSDGLNINEKLKSELDYILGI